MNAWAAWTNDDALLLSQNVQLILRETVEVNPEQEEQEEEAKAKGKGLDAGKIIQIVIICICFTLAPIILFQDNSQVSGASATKSKSDLVADAPLT